MAVARIAFITGCLLLLAAAAAAVAEAVVRGAIGLAGLWTPAFEVWATLAPEGLESTRTWIRHLAGQEGWSAVSTVLRRVPAFLLLGVPGAVLVWWTRPRRRPDEDDTDALDEDTAADLDEDPVFLYERLARRAREEGYVEGDDMAPTDSHRPWLNDSDERDGGDGERNTSADPPSRTPDA